MAEKLAAGVPLCEVAEPEPDLGGQLEPAYGCRPYGAHREYGPDWGRDGTKSGFVTRTVTTTLPSGEVVTGEVCDLCGSGVRRDGRDALAHNQNCEACGRSHRDGEAAALLR